MVMCKAMQFWCNFWGANFASVLFKLLFPSLLCADNVGADVTSSKEPFPPSQHQALCICQLNRNGAEYNKWPRPGDWAKTGPVKQVQVHLQPIDCEKVQTLLHQTLCSASFSLAPMASERFGEQIGVGNGKNSCSKRGEWGAASLSAKNLNVAAISLPPVLVSPSLSIVYIHITHLCQVASYACYGDQLEWVRWSERLNPMVAK